MASTCSICVRKNLKKKNSSIGSPSSPLTDTCNHSDKMKNNNNSFRAPSSHKKNSSFDGIDAYKLERPSSTCSVRSTQSEISPLTGTSRRIVLSPTFSLRSFGSRPHSRNSIDMDEMPNYARTTHAHSNRVRSIMSTKFNSTGKIGSITLSAKYGTSNNSNNVEYSPKPKSRLPIPTYMTSVPSGERGSIKDWIPLGNPTSQEQDSLIEDDEELSTPEKLAQKFRKPRKGLMASAGKRLTSQSIIDSLTAVVEEEKDSPEFNTEPIEISEDLSISHANSNFLNFEEEEIEFEEDNNNTDDEGQKRSENDEQSSPSQQFNRPISFNEFQSYQNSMISQSGDILELMKEEVKAFPSVHALVDYVDKNGGENNEFDKEKFIEHYNKINNDSNIDLSAAPSHILTDIPNQETSNGVDQSNIDSNSNQPASRSIIPPHIESELKQNSERLEKIKTDYNQFINDMDKLKEFFEINSNNKKFGLSEEFEAKINEEILELENITQEKPQITISVDNNLQTLLDETSKIAEILKSRLDKVESQQFEEASKPLYYHVLSFLSYSFNLFLSILLILILTAYTHAYFNRFIQFVDFTNGETFKATSLDLIQQLVNHIIFSYKTYTPKYILFTPDDNLAPIPQLLIIWAIVTAIKKVLNPDRYYNPSSYPQQLTESKLTKS